MGGARGGGRRYSAIFQRSSYRAPFALRPVPGGTLRELVAAAGAPGTEGRLVEPRAEAGVLAELLGHTDAHLPHRITLTERITAESLLIVLTADDTRLDHLHAGAAMQQTWLTAVAAGLAGSVLTQPLHLPEVRAGLIERLELPGFPQAILRFGYPVTALGALTGANRDAGHRN